MRKPASILTLCLLAAAAVCTPALCRADITRNTDLAGFLADIKELGTRIEAADAAHAGAIASELPTAWHVRDGSDEYTVTTEWIAESLRVGQTRPAHWAQTRAALLHRFHEVRGQAWLLQSSHENSSDQSPPPNIAEARAALRDVVARGEFKQRDEASWNDELRRRFNRWLVDLLNRLPGAHGVSAEVSQGLAWIAAIGALIALVIYLLRARLPRRSITPLALQLPRPTSAEWAARAYAALREGDAREAMHCGYHAVLFRLEEQGVWHVDDARTPREYVRLLPAQDARRAAFIDLTRRFEQTWYGSRAADGAGLIANLEAFGCSASPSKRAI